jgi:hypothetical protein
MNFICANLKNGREALINLDTISYITENSDYNTTVSFVGGRENLVLDERFEDVQLTISTIQRRQNNA